MFPPEFGFRYRSVSSDHSRERETVERDLLWFASPSSFNDPFEAKPLVQRNLKPLSTSEIMGLIKRRYPNVRFAERYQRAMTVQRTQSDPEKRSAYFKMLDDALLRQFDACTMCCFNSVGDDIRMWSYYSSGHTGYCLVYQFPERWQYKNIEGNEARLAPVPVEYCDDYPSIDPEFDRNDPAQCLAVMKACLLTKSTAWSWEKERRCVRINTRPGHQQMPDSALKALILGARIRAKDSDLLCGLAKARRNPPAIIRALPERHRFQLRLEPI
jgi:hypothetical protein